MHGVPENLPLQSFVGDVVEQIRISQFQLQLHFQSAGSICITGHWELSDANGTEIDRAEEHQDRLDYKVHLLLGQFVSGFVVNPPHTFGLQFASHNLTVFDDSRHYESFSVNPSGAASVHV